MYERKHCYGGERTSVNIATLLCDCLHVAGTLLFQCWHSFVSVLALFCFSAGALFFSVLALYCFSAGTLLFQRWHSGTLLFSIERLSAGARGTAR